MGAGYHIVNTLRVRQNGRRFTDDIFKRISLNKKVWILIKISLKLIPKGSNKSLALNRRQAIIWTSGGLVYWQIYHSASMS